MRPPERCLVDQNPRPPLPFGLVHRRVRLRQQLPKVVLTRVPVRPHADAQHQLLSPGQVVYVKLLCCSFSLELINRHRFSASTPAPWLAGPPNLTAATIASSGLVATSKDFGELRHGEVQHSPGPDGQDSRRGSKKRGRPGKRGKEERGPPERCDT